MKLFRKIATILSLAILFGAFTGCGIGKMVKNADKISYTVKPDPLELHGDSVRIAVNGTFPAKFFHKKAELTITPVVKYAGGEKELKDIVFRGEKVEGGGKSISNKEGGKFDANDRFFFVNGMEKSEVVLRAKVKFKSKSTPLPEYKLVEGTIVTPLLLKKDYKPVIVADKFDKNPTVTQKANIYFLKDQWDVRAVELKSDEMNNLYNFIKREAVNGSEFTKLDIYGYASPEGELARNAKLSDNRANEAYKVVSGELKKAKVKDLDKKQDFYSKITTNYEDWDGLKNMLQSSSISGKDQAISIINTFNDPEAREAEFRKLAAYDPIYDAYFPKLRRAEINLVSKLKVRSDAEILNLAKTNPSELGNEELLYATTLVQSDEERLAIYQAHQKAYPEDYRGFNNAGGILVKQGKISEAKNEFEKANRIAANNASVQNNLGVIAGFNGDKKAAEGYFASAGNSPEAKHNAGNIAILNGKYAMASASYGDACSFNASLAKLLEGNTSGALQTLDCSEDKDTAEGNYLRAVIGARSGNKDMMISNLQKAFTAKPALKEKAKNDLEFRKFISELTNIN
jgi:outer membrane protein OmpA-like peptidoglycan-associated protein